MQMMQMEMTMRRMLTALIAAGAIVTCGAAQAHVIGDYVEPFTANDTGGIISYPLTHHVDAHALANANCEQYGKVARVTGVDARPGGYLSFACVWVPHRLHALRVRY
jgi:hypothetical protein